MRQLSDKGKEALRREMRERLKETPGEEFYTQGLGASALLCSAPIWSSYKTLFIFLSLPLEIDTRPILEAAFKAGKNVFAPGVEDERLAFYPLGSLDDPFRRGPFGIREPDPGLNKSAAAGDFPALIITPGLAFDREGMRLGRGKAYYDRFFARLDDDGVKYHALGLCMDFQLVDKVPGGEGDKKMGGILTGKELYAI